MKKLFLSLLALLPIVAWADANGTCGKNLTWTYVETTKTLTISGTGAMYNYYDYYEGPWPSLVNVVIEEGVTSIGNWVFFNCRSLTSVTIPNSVTSIGNSAFDSCSGLTSVTIPNSVTSIGAGAFYECSSLTSVHISDLASWCKISFGDNPLWYAHHLYLNNEEINDLIIPDGVTSIEERAFQSCSGLTSVTIPNSVTSIGNSAFSNCSSLTSVTIPNSVTSIGNSAFSNCSSLTSVTIPNSVTNIGTNAFNGCTVLMSVTSYIKEPFNVSNLFLNETYRQGTLYVPKGTKDLYIRFDGWREFLNIEEMGEEPAPNGECATPTIVVVGNSVSFQCETPEAEFESVLTTEEQFSGAEISLDIDEITYTLTVYATAPGYNRSKPAKYVFKRKKGDVNGDGAVSPADAIESLYIFFGVGQNHAPTKTQPTLEPQ